MANPLLILEDKRLLADELARHFARQGWETRTAGTLAEARDVLVGRGFEPLVILADMSLPDGYALDLVEDMRGQGVPGEWILLTGYGGVTDTVRALRLGAYDFLEKPCPLDRLTVVLGGAKRAAGDILKRLAD
ncbi:Response regulator PrrA [Thiorhodovibrio winogradskyi]|uniref:Response regulator PrrA n=1 Tax=Thiorhodovibrio winogradskyi TaxID=77007 RepID=A0ABZ0S502_9GAMM|nr:response regulator [Thiorhodovibrio winogradskyi]